MGVKDNFIYEECMKELNTMFKGNNYSIKRSFGEYFDNQRDRIVSDMQTGKNAELYNAWREDYDKRQLQKQEVSLLNKMAPVGPKEKKLLKETIEETKVRNESE